MKICAIQHINHIIIIMFEVGTNSGGAYYLWNRFNTVWLELRKCDLREPLVMF